MANAVSLLSPFSLSLSLWVLLCLQHKPWILAVYGMWACRCVLGTQGTAMVLIHATISFCVAQFRSQFLSWLCSLSLLSTLRLQDVEEVKVRVSVFFFFIPMGGRKPVLQCQYPGRCLCFRMSIQELGWGSPSWPQRVLHPAILCI